MTDLRAAVVYDHLYPESRGGGERVYVHLAEVLHDRGFVVDYVTRTFSDAADREAYRVVPVFAGELYDAHGVRTIGGAVRFARAVYRHFRLCRSDYDMVVASALPVLTLLAVRAALRGSGTIIVGDWLEVWRWRKWREYKGLVGGAIGFITQYLGLRASKINTVNSGFTAARARSLRPQVRVIVLGLVDLAGEPGAVAAVADPPHVVFVGRHIADKQLSVLPAAMAVARASVPHLTCTVAGSGPDTPNLEAEIARTGTADAFAIVGRLSDDDLRTTLGTAAALINPSRREGFGLVVAEAAAVGVPSVVIAGDDNAAVELIAEGVNGFVARDGSPESLGAAIVLAVQGGAALRASTREWYAHARQTRGMAASVDEVLEAVGLAGPRPSDD